MATMINPVKPSSMTNVLAKQGPSESRKIDSLLIANGLQSVCLSRKQMLRTGKHLLEGGYSRRECRRNRQSIVMQAVEKSSGLAGTKTQEDVVDTHIGQYCDIQKGGKKTIGEMEQEFLLALQSFYIDEAPIMSNEEFDNLKEELLWEGSKVAVLNTEEQRFMEAALAYQAGKPFLSDTEYDKLKLQLKKQGSKLAIAGPRCSIRSQRVYSDSAVDYLRMTLLNVPAALVALAVVFFLDDLSGFEITYLLELPEPYSFLFTWFIVLPFTYLTAQAITNFILKDFLILRGPCPSCAETNVSFFGSILGIANEGQTSNNVKCESCGSTLKFDLESRRITLEAQGKPKVPAKPPAKKPAPAGKA